MIANAKSTCNSSKNGDNKTFQCESKNYCTCKKDHSWSRNTSICDNSRYLKSIINESVIVCNEIINVTEIVSTNVTNFIPTNVTRAVSINFDDKMQNMKWIVTFILFR